MKVWAIVRTILFLIGTYYLIRFLIKVLAKPANAGQNKKTKTKSGTNISDNLGEYVDYEEIKNKKG